MPRMSQVEIDATAKQTGTAERAALRWLGARAGKAMPKGSGAPSAATLEKLAGTYGAPLCTIYASGEAAITPTGRAVLDAIPAPRGKR